MLLYFSNIHYILAYIHAEDAHIYIQTHKERHIYLPISVYFYIQSTSHFDKCKKEMTNLPTALHRSLRSFADLFISFQPSSKLCGTLWGFAHPLRTCEGLQLSLELCRAPWRFAHPLRALQISMEVCTPPHRFSDLCGSLQTFSEFSRHPWRFALLKALKISVVFCTSPWRSVGLRKCLHTSVEVCKPL